jgi:hypothetical protein
LSRALVRAIATTLSRFAVDQERGAVERISLIGNRNEA